jgi:hypothetical protein
MTLQTITGDEPTAYAVDNPLSGERILLQQCSGGLTSDYAQNARYGHQFWPGPPTGVTSWKLGTKSQFVVLRTAEIAVIAVPVSTFGSTGALTSPVTTALADQVTVVRQNNKAGNLFNPLSLGPTPQLELIQGSNSVLLTQQNAADLAPQLTAIGAT